MGSRICPDSLSCAISARGWRVLRRRFRGLVPLFVTFIKIVLRIVKELFVTVHVTAGVVITQ
jgi:hypothetical protein